MLTVERIRQRRRARHAAERSREINKMIEESRRESREFEEKMAEWKAAGMMPLFGDPAEHRASVNRMLNEAGFNTLKDKPKLRAV